MALHLNPILIFNSLPEGYIEVDKAVQGLLEMIRFEREFVQEPTMPHQVPIIVLLSGKFASYKVHLLTILYWD